MNRCEYEYDVAFSFHSLDQGMAVELNDLLQDRFRTFIYFQRQEDVLAGTDGEQTFSEIFGEKSRCVVVFCRKEWGQTPFTRIEETAIRNRAFDNGFDFSLFIPTDVPPSVPKWLPKTRLWYGIGDYGLNGAAAVVERLIGEMGGIPSIESVEDRAARFQRAANFEKTKKAFRESIEGVKAADDAFQKLKADIKSYASKVAATSPSLPKIKVEEVSGSVLISGAGACMALRWERHFANSLDGSELKVKIFDGVPRLPGLYVWEDPKLLKSRKYEYHLALPKKHGYIEIPMQSNSTIVHDLAGDLLRLYLDVAEKNRRR